MANKPIEIQFLADVAQYLRETKRVEVSTEDIADALVATSNSSDDLNRKLSKAMRDAASDTQVLERALKDVEKASRTVGDSADDGFRRISDSAEDSGSRIKRTMGDTGREAAGEFKQGLAETLASGGSPSDLILGTLAGVIPGLGPIMATAAAGLAGIAGLVFKQLQEEKEKTEELLRSFSSTLDSLVTQGVANATKVERFQAFSDFVRDNTARFREMADEAKTVGVSLDDVAAAAAQGGKPLEDMYLTLSNIRNTSKDAAGRMSEQAVAADQILALLGQIDTTASEFRSDMDLVAGASQAIAGNMGLVDTNMDGVIDDSDEIKTNLEGAETASSHLDHGVPKTKQDAASTKEYFDQLWGTGVPDPGMPKTLADAKSITATINALPKELKVQINTQVARGLAATRGDTALQDYLSRFPYGSSGTYNGQSR